MSINTMKQALEALGQVRFDYLDMSFVDVNKICKAVEALRAAIQQAEDKTDEPVGCVDYNQRGNISWLFGPQLPEGTKLYTHPAPGVPEFSRIAKRKLTDLQEQGFAITGYAIQRGPVRGFIDGFGFVGWWQGEPDPGVPDGWQLAPIEPTAEMLQAALKVATPGALRAAWARMLAACPVQKGGE